MTALRTGVSASALRVTGGSFLPDGPTTVVTCRHLLETQGLGMGLFEDQYASGVSRASVRAEDGTIVDASIIDAPSSTKNRRGERDPEMHQTKKGNQGTAG